MLVTSALVIAGVVLASGTGERLTHPLWLDESITATLANDRSLPHLLRAIYGGAENNPPAYYLFVWPLVRLFGGLSPFGLRILAGACMTLAIAGVYAIGRRFSSRLGAAVAALVVLAHPFVIAQLFEVRFYGAWLAATAWLLWSVLARSDDDSGISKSSCVLAVIVASIHWFGIIAVALICTANALAADGNDATRRARRGIPLLVAGGAVLALSPFLMSQRAGLSVPTWIDRVTSLDIRRLVYQWLVNPSSVVVGLCLAWWALGAVRHCGQAPRVRLVTPAMSLLLFPMVLVLISVLVQPVIYERYFIVSVLPLGALAAWAIGSGGARYGKPVLAVTAIGLLVIAGREMRAYDRLVAITDWRIRNAVAVTGRVIAEHGPLPVIFVRRFEHYPTVLQRPDLAAASALVDFDGEPNAGLMRRTLFERDMARRFTRFYPQYHLAPLDSLRRHGPFVVVTSDNEQDEMRRLFAGFVIQRRDRDVYSVSPHPAWVSPSAHP